MKFPLFLFFISLIALMSLESTAQVAINTNGAVADETAILDVKSTTQGLLIPRMSTANRIGITNPANGLFVFDTDTKSVWFYETTTTSWKKNGSILCF